MKLTGMARSNNRGQALVEYALILGFVSIVGVLSLRGIGNTVYKLFAKVVFP